MKVTRWQYSLPPDFNYDVTTVSPTSVSENGVVGQATSFNLTLTGETPYTYTQTFGNICNVVINGNIATVTITPTQAGNLNGTITFNGVATCTVNMTVEENAETGYVISPTTITQTDDHGCGTSLKYNGTLITSWSSLFLNSIKNDSTGEYIGEKYDDSNIIYDDVDTVMKLEFKDESLWFTAYEGVLPNGEYTVNFSIGAFDGENFDIKFIMDV